MDRLLAMAVLLPTMCCGCATIMAGKTETVHINSEPQGVEVLVDGAAYTTPVIVSLARDSDHYVNFPNGQRVDITRHLEGAVFGNILFGGVIGLVVDAVSGAARFGEHPGDGCRSPEQDQPLRHCQPALRHGPKPMAQGS